MKASDCFFAQQCEKFYDDAALVEDRLLITYAQLENYVRAACQYFEAQQIKKGDHVAVSCKNTAKTIIVLYALWRLKAVAVLIDPRAPKETKLKLVKHLNCSAVIAPNPSEFRDLTDNSPVIKLFDIPLQPEYQKEDRFSIDGEANATVLLSSGSTGEPKAVLHTFKAHLASAQNAHTVIPFNKGDRWLLALPLNHVSGLSLLFRALINGGTLIIHNKKNTLVETIRQQKATHASLVVTQLKRMLQDEGSVKVLRNLKAILLGGGPVPEPVKRRAIENRLPVHVTYGLTEIASQVATSGNISEGNTKAQLLGHCEAKIIDGEIVLRSESCFKGYVKDCRTESCFDGEGWFMTGDLGELNGRYLEVFGRKDNMFISGGENVYPEEIEKALLGIEGIEEACVVPRACEEFQFRPVAFIRNFGALSGNSIREYLAQTLPRFKIPDDFLPWPDDLNSGGIKLKRKDFKGYLPRSQEPSRGLQG